MRIEKKFMSLIFFILSYCSTSIGQENYSTENEVESKALDINKLFKKADYENVSLSPDGKHIALIRNEDDTPIIIIVAVDTMTAINQIYVDKKDTVGDYTWANNESLLIYLYTKNRNKEQKDYYGEIYAININETQGEFIFGVRSLVRRGRLKSSVTDADFEKHLAHPKIISKLASDPKHIIISTSQYDSEGMWVFRLNINTGNLETLAKIDDTRADHKSTSIAYFEKTHDLWLRTKHGNEALILARYNFDDNSWVEYKPKNASTDLSIINIYKDNKQLIVRDYCGKDTMSICLFDPKTQTLSSLFTVKGYDVDNLYLDNQNTPYALSYFDQYPQYKIIDSTNPKASILSDFLVQFSGHNIVINWGHTQEKIALVSLTSDIQPTIWYLYNREINKLTFVAKRYKNIDAKQLYPQYTFAFQSRDNTPIQGYISLPKNASIGSTPAVVLVHGGPHSRDYWGFDPEIQLLASRGYAVIQVNFRGSKGFGWKFEAAGHEQWGEKIQYDILDSINYLTENQYIDKNRLCIMGGSFGGYSAMQSSILAPSLFKCVIARSGVYDLPLFIAEKSPDIARAYLKNVGPKEIQHAHSPINAIHLLQAPVLLVHGTNDDRTPLQQAEVLLKQLEKHDKPYEWFEIENEGHYFYNPKNRIEYHEKVLLFLNEHNPVIL